MTESDDSGSSSSSDDESDRSASSQSSRDASPSSQLSSNDPKDGSSEDGSGRPSTVLKPLEEYVKAATDGFVYPGKQRSGSKPSLENRSVWVIKPDSEVAYRKRLAEIARIQIEKVKKRHRIAREALRAAGTDTMGLESSSEEETDKTDNIDPKNRMLDWHELGRSTWWADERLYNAIPVPVINSVVGWAHHQTHDGEDTNGHADNHLNPFRDLPNNPMPPTHLEWIMHRATEMATRTVLKTHTYLVAPDHQIDHTEGKEKMKLKKRLDWQTWGYDSQDETYQLVKKNFKRKETVDVVVPLQEQFTDDDPNPMDLFSTSAKVSLGIAIEDMVTASLLPLAKEHVKRCRLLNGQEAFDAWTLPPEEAVLSLATTNASLGSAQDDTKTGFDE